MAESNQNSDGKDPGHPPSPIFQKLLSSFLKIKRTRSFSDSVGYVVRSAEDYIWDERHDRLIGPPNWLYRALQVFAHSIRGMNEHQLLLRASALTYHLLLSLVPLLAVAFVVLKWFNLQSYLGDIIERLSGVIPTELPDGREDPVALILQFTEQTEQYIQQADVGGLTGFGVIGAIFISLSMLRITEQAMNAIWGISRGRSWNRILADYISMMVIAPVLLGIGVYSTTLLHVPSQIPLSDLINNAVLSPIVAILPFIAIWGAFVFLYYYMPNTRVYWLSALIGGVTAGSLWHLAQFAYIQVSIYFYTARFNVIYGAFWWVFILLAWIYISWTILLYGAEITAAHQHLDELRRYRRHWTGNSADQETLTLQIAALLAQPSMVALAVPFEPAGVTSLCDKLRVPPVPVQCVLDRFEEIGLVMRMNFTDTYLLCRAPDEVYVLDILRLVRQGSITATMPPDESNTGVFAETSRELIRKLQTYTLRDLARMPLAEIHTLRI